MIEAKRDKYFEKVFDYYVQWQIKKNFYKIKIKDPYVKERKMEKGQLYIVNHSSWWDGLLIFYLSRNYFKQDSYAMMSEKGIKEFPFFRKIGAYSVDYTSPKGSIKSLQYTLKLLNQGSPVWLFPQGEEQHVEKRPLAFKQGAGYLVEKTGEPFMVTPLSIYYTFRHDQLAECWIQVGKSILSTEIQGGNRAGKTSFLEEMVTKELSSLKEDLINENEHLYKDLLKGKKTLSEWFTFWKKKKGETF
ncbi:lysophospholipid acyltransferase family protein [Mangrovibacillus cuniculi]|uniref:Glycerol acyltransferase n=1 Tax=Mangrovibacillus cuniculi TaxID=2593652 RepID=A0A7S8HFB8_9BACI|nr:lysophospholipid acyltransferase family protein [Mangrovibacillus cuniculi]QPC46597.1 glycerol acyltransferase [Mangrovibacillus cuniculi]